MRTVNPLATIAYRDFTKFRRDRARVLSTFIFPFVFIGVLGGSLQANLSDGAGYNLLTFIFTGVIGQTLFQSTAAGIISLIEDRVNDFSQELFISPISRYTIILGKIIGESMVALAQGVGVLAFGYVVGIRFGLLAIASLIPFAIVCCLFGGAFGVLVLSNLSTERSANQIFPFIIFPQFFLAGVFSPIKKLPLILDILSRISPMRYAVDLIRGIYYLGKPEYDLIVLASPLYNLVVIGILFTLFITIGTALFTRNERNR